MYILSLLDLVISDLSLEVVRDTHELVTEDDHNKALTFDFNISNSNPNKNVLANNSNKQCHFKTVNFIELYE